MNEALNVSFSFGTSRTMGERTRSAQGAEPLPATKGTPSPGRRGVRRHPGAVGAERRAFLD